MKEGLIIWLTGLPASGKTTLASLLRKAFEKEGHRSEILDGDELRKWLSPEATFSREDRERHNKRVAHLCALLARNNIMALVALVSPYRSMRQYARDLMPDRFLEVYLDCPIEVCIKRDPKGQYKMALDGKIKKMTGIDDPYEKPLTPDLTIHTNEESPDESVKKILQLVRQKQQALG